jgi:acetaldehyde dehydrogenase / alcohol dehydrogenase
MNEKLEKNSTVPTGAEEVDLLASRAKTALQSFMSYSQEQIDAIVKAMATRGLANHMRLAHAAIDETGRGVFEDKVTKNIFATEYVYHSIKYDKTVGVIRDNEYEKYEEVAEPIGVIAALTPVTNPTSTTMFKAMIAVKARNPIIFAFHPSAQKCSRLAAQILYDAAREAGAPEHCIQWIEHPSVETTGLLMKHKDVALVLATGGAGMVQAAYSTGKPALGVGPGNVPCYIHESAKLRRAVNELIMSKTFDNGMICASEQAVIVDRTIAPMFEQLMQDNNCRFLTPAESKQLEGLVIKKDGCSVNADIVGKSAASIARGAGLDVPDGTKILLAPMQGVGADYPLSREKLSPILAYYIVDNADEGIALAEKVVEFGGMGHSAVIHAEDESVVERYSRAIKVGRLIVNSPSSQGAIGDIYNANTPSLTLGCGSYGHNSTTSNVSALNLINIKKVAKRRVNMQWFKVPEKIYFEADSIQYLEKMEDISRVFIVTDPMMVQLGYVSKIEYFLNKRQTPVAVQTFTEVEPDPSVETIERGVREMARFQPDAIIALGGGSAIDAAKGMWLFYEYPDISFADLTLKFMDIRKRVVKFPKLGKKARLVAIPTTSGTGSEVTSFAVITDRTTNTKYPLADYELTPNIAIIDPMLVMSMPKAITADTGMDVLTHAIEAYVSVLASDYTDALAMKAIELVFEYLPRAYKDGADALAREKMHNASTIAGMAFANAFLGINHSMAHKLGGEFHIPHGRANAILLPHVIAYNATKPTKFATFPKYESFIAHVRYAEIARHLGLPAATTEEGVQSLIAAVRQLNEELNIPQSISACGIHEKEYTAAIPMLAEKAFEDQCTTANPRYPLVSEIAELFREIY